jgi:hypothetical protein
MSTWQVALVWEQGVEFAVVYVEDSVINDARCRENLHRAWAAQLRRPVALLGLRQHRAYGHRHIVDYVDAIDPVRLPWREMTIAA